MTYLRLRIATASFLTYNRGWFLAYSRFPALSLLSFLLLVQMNILAVIVTIALVAIVFQQTCSVLFTWFAWRPKKEEIVDADLPPALVLLPLRGADPFLSDGLGRLLRQDYPKYQVRIIIDHREDPARAVVEKVLSETGATNVEVTFLENPVETCTLRCSALYQATENLPEDCGVVVTIDADVMAHETWLRELVAPLKDPAVGAAMGNRWYSPSTRKMASWIRYVWNAAAVVAMYYTKIPWGGGLAYRASLLREGDLRDGWLKAASEDVTLPAKLRKKHLKLVFVPSIISVNHEETDFAGCMRFIYRQLIWTRLHHAPGWWMSVFLHFLMAILQLFAIGLATVLAVQGEWLHAGILFGAVGFFMAVQVGLVFLIELNIRRFLIARGESGTRLRLVTILATLICQFLTIPWLWRSLTIRRLEWRGIHYTLGDGAKIRMVEHIPFVDARADDGSTKVVSSL